MSELVVYCVPKTFTPAMMTDMLNGKEESAEIMSSFNESRARKLMVEMHQQKFQALHQRRLSRIYPKVFRLFFLRISTHN